MGSGLAESGRAVQLGVKGLILSKGFDFVFVLSL